MVHRKYTVNKVKKDHTKSSQGRRPCSGESDPLSQQVSVKEGYKNGKKQIWIVLAPVLDVFILNISLIACYVIDLYKGNIPPLPFLPTISEVGSNIPTRYLFTFGITASSLTTFLVVYFRHKQVSFSYDGCSNMISVTAGYLAALSKLLLGAFQYHPTFKWLHYFALIGYVLFSYVYIVSQVFLTYYTKTASSMLVLLIRLVICLLMVVFGGLFCIIQLPQYEKLNHPPYNVAQLAQWTYWTLLNIYTMTFAFEFTRIRVSWNILASQHTHQLTSDDWTTSEEYSHELYCADSDTSSHMVGKHDTSKFKSEFGIPRELTTKV